MAAHDGPHVLSGTRDGAGPARTAAAAVVGLVVCLGLLVLVPWLGALLSVAALVAVVPLGGTSASARLVGLVAISSGLLGLALAVGDGLAFRVLSPDRVRIAFAVPVVVAAVVVVVSAATGRRVRWARADLGLVAPVLVAVAAWAATGLPARGVDLGQGIGGLMLMGWDHQSHFSVFSYLYDQGGVWRPDASAPVSMFLGYPPLAGAIGVGLAMLVSPGDLQPVQQFPLYVQATAVTFALGAALVAWTAGSLGRRVAEATDHGARAGGVGLVSGLVVGGYVVLGPPVALFDYGFTNFFLAIALATAASWLAFTRMQEPGARANAYSAAVVVATAVALALLWTPLVVLVVPVGLALVVAAVRARQWWALATTALLVLVGGSVAAWQVLGIAPSGGEASSLLDTLARASGGQPAVPLPHLVALAAVGIAAPVLLGRTRWPSGFASLAVPAAGAVVAAAFAVNTSRAGFSVPDAYYVAKALWIVYLAVIPVAGGAVAVGALALVGRLDPSASLWRARGRLALAGVLSAVLLWAAAPTQNAPNGAIDYYAMPVGTEAVSHRWTAFREVPQGEVVADAVRRSGRWPGRVAIVWDGGDLLTNRWVGSLRGDLDQRANAVYTVLAAPPYAEPSRDALGASLAADPTLSVVLVAATPESLAVLRPLKKEFPGRVTVVSG